MAADQVYLGASAYAGVAGPATGGFVQRDGECYACIENVDGLAPFLMSVVGHGDVWLFAGSNGPFTAGRVGPEGALFPYQTADKILRHADSSGALSIMLVRRGARWMLWEPWRDNGRVYRLHRNLYKHVHGTSVVFEEENADLELRFSWRLSTCQRYGLVRECRLENLGRNEAAEVRYLDGLHQLLPPGVSQETYARYSYLAAGYMRQERVPAVPLAVFALNAAITDRAEPCESLRATAAWSLGHAEPTILLCDRQVAAFRRGEAVQAEQEVRGEFGAFLTADTVTLAPGAAHSWIHVADTKLDHAALIGMREELRAPGRLARTLRAAVAADGAGLRRLVAAADGLQHTADAAARAHHFANVLFNCMRGGAFGNSYRFSRSDVASFLRQRNVAVAARHAAWLDGLPAELTLDGIRAEAAGRGDAQLTRLVREYLPLTFSRRHGDPSRPWNHFAIHVQDAAGDPVYGYQGNWRDIFQNWESLARSFPAALESMIAVFLNASTADGYNPYRITRDGIDWEAHNPHDPWSHIGYWGDHQIVYLLRLLESCEQLYPNRLAAGLRDEVYAYAQVPYEIAGFDAILADPRHTITFNRELHECLVARAREQGADGKLLANARGGVLQVSLAEKLLVPLLAKLSNFVPEGGVWLNTQRPEWNDANNALAGWGLSVVTVQYLRRYLVFLDGILAGAGDAPLTLSAPVAEFVARATAILEKAAPCVQRGFDDASRLQIVTALGRAGEAYRSTLYRDGLEGRTAVPVAALRALVAAALPVVEQTIRANRRGDGLYHSYNLLHIAGERAVVKHLYPMLEGQVAALSSGLLMPAEALAVLRALRASDLYRGDQHSYLLYPDRELPSFLQRNTLPGDAAQRAPLLAELAAAGERSPAAADVLGRWHFQADLRNAADVAARLDELAATNTWRAAVQRDRAAILELWETVFRHSEFTGRSGTFFMFEGLGSIYWHMVAKLLLAAQECWRAAATGGADKGVATALADAYNDVRDGLGFRKTPAVYGAFPTDPYSHTPRHRGAQQPGMTGQVKEEILTRWGELGIAVDGGCVRFAPRLLSRAEFFHEPQRFAYVDVHGQEQAWALPADSLAFTYCQVPVCYQLADAAELSIERADGGTERMRGDTLDAATSASIFARRGEIRRVVVLLPR